MLNKQTNKRLTFAIKRAQLSRYANGPSSEKSRNIRQSLVCRRVHLEQKSAIDCFVKHQYSLTASGAIQQNKTRPSNDPVASSHRFHTIAAQSLSFATLSRIRSPDNWLDSNLNASWSI